MVTFNFLRLLPGFWRERNREGADGTLGIGVVFLMIHVAVAAEYVAPADVSVDQFDCE